ALLPAGIRDQARDLARQAQPGDRAQAELAGIVGEGLVADPVPLAERLAAGELIEEDVAGVGERRDDVLVAVAIGGPVVEALALAAQHVARDEDRPTAGNRRGREDDALLERREGGDDLEDRA